MPAILRNRWRQLIALVVISARVIDGSDDINSPIVGVIRPLFLSINNSADASSFGDINPFLLGVELKEGSVSESHDDQEVRACSAASETRRS